ncbi:hypothetical protein [Xanthomonas sp. 3058]|nr:hypothetical protein [Xanthomonas sp. 3058]MBB5863437.1 hypothetical protein [Xanthomonas sp. 3058]
MPSQRSGDMDARKSASMWIERQALQPPLDRIVGLYRLLVTAC